MTKNCVICFEPTDDIKFKCVDCNSGIVCEKCANVMYPTKSRGYEDEDEDDDDDGYNIDIKKYKCPICRVIQYKWIYNFIISTMNNEINDNFAYQQKPFFNILMDRYMENDCRWDDYENHINKYTINIKTNNYGKKYYTFENAEMTTNYMKLMYNTFDIYTDEYKTSISKNGTIISNMTIGIMGGESQSKNEIASLFFNKELYGNIIFCFNFMSVKKELIKIKNYLIHNDLIEYKNINIINNDNY